MTAQPDLALVADILDDYDEVCCLIADDDKTARYSRDTVEEQARLLREADNAHKARTVNRSAASEASPAEQGGEDGLLLAVVGRAHFGNPIPAEWYSAARALIRRLATPEQPGSAPQGEVSATEVMAALRHRVKEAGSQQAFALQVKASTSYVSDVLNGKREIPEDWVFCLGYRKGGWVRVCDPLATPPPAPAAEQEVEGAELIALRWFASKVSGAASLCCKGSVGSPLLLEWFDKALRMAAAPTQEKV